MCQPKLTGTFCSLCEKDNTSASVYYVKASKGQRADCNDCGNTLAATAGVTLGAVAVVVIAVAVSLCYQPSKKIADRIKHLVSTYTPHNKLKIIVGFYMIATKVDRSAPPPSPPHQPPPTTTTTTTTHIHTLSLFLSLTHSPAGLATHSTNPLHKYPPPPHPISVYSVSLPEDVREFLDSISISITLGFQGIAMTPLECVGASGYVPRLIFWMVILPLAALFAILCVALELTWAEWPSATPHLRHDNQRCSRLEAVLEHSVPWLMTVIFFLYPVVTNVAFQVLPPQPAQQPPYPPSPYPLPNLPPPAPPQPLPLPLPCPHLTPPPSHPTLPKLTQPNLTPPNATPT